jgi:hypothetical protein
MLFRMVELAHLDQGQTEIVLSLGITGIDLQCFVEVLEGSRRVCAERPQSGSMIQERSSDLTDPRVLRAVDDQSLCFVRPKSPTKGIFALPKGGGDESAAPELGLAEFMGWRTGGHDRISFTELYIRATRA